MATSSLPDSLFAMIMSRFVREKIKGDNKRDAVMALIEKLREWLITQT